MTDAGDDLDGLGTAFLVGFCGFAWTFVAVFWSVHAVAPLAILTFLTWRQVERTGWLSISVGSQRPRTTATDGGHSVAPHGRSADCPTQYSEETTAGDRKPPRGN